MGLDGHDDTCEIARAASLFSQLPRESRVVQEAEPDALWDEATQFLRLIEYDLQAIHYALCGGKGPKPEMVRTPSERIKREESMEAAIAAKDEIDGILSGIFPGRGA